MPPPNEPASKPLLAIAVVVIALAVIVAAFATCAVGRRQLPSQPIVYAG